MAVPQVTGMAGCFVDDECEGMAVLEAGLKPRQPGLHRERSFLLPQQAQLHDASQCALISRAGFRAVWPPWLHPDEVTTLESDGTLFLETGTTRPLAVRRAM